MGQELGHTLDWVNMAVALLAGRDGSAKPRDRGCRKQRQIEA